MKTSLMKLSSRSLERGLCAVACALLGLWCYQHVAVGVYEAAEFNGFIANGPFQLYNPLRRLAAGQIAGVDFQFFHGLGVPFVHYPLFVLFGKTFYAAELSRQLTSIIGYFVSLFVFVLVATKGKLSHALIGCVAVIYLGIFISFDEVSPFTWIATAGNSLLGVRAAFPLITFAVLLSDLRWGRKAILGGICLALTLCCGTEHGLAMLLIVFGVGVPTMGIRAWRKQPREEATTFESPLFFVLLFASFIVSLGAIYLTLSTPAGMIAALRYNLSSVPAEQYWYFGVPPNEFAGTLAELGQLGKRNCLFLLLLCGSFFVLWWKVTFARVADRKLTIVACWMLGYAVISCLSCLGMLSKGYLAPAFRISQIVFCLWLYRTNALSTLVANVKTRWPQWQTPFAAASVLFAVGWILGGAFLAIQSFPPAHFKLWPFPSQQLSITWQKHLQQAETALATLPLKSQPPRLWSLYAGLLEDKYGVFHPREDYIIHALGKERRAAYLQGLRDTQPDVVQTIRKSFFYHQTRFHNYEQWLRNSSWEVYEDILNNYDLLTVTDRSIFWQRKSAVWQAPAQNYQTIPVPPNATTVELPIASKTPTIYVVRVQYHTTNPWRRVPIVGGLPRFLIHTENTWDDLPVSLPPYAQEFLFHVLVKPDCKPQLRFQVASPLPAASLQITSVAIRPLPLGQRELEAFLY
jgi:hypothetical protein